MAPLYVSNTLCFPLAAAEPLQKVVLLKLTTITVAVVSFALAAGTYSIGRKFAVDKNLRLARPGPAKVEHHDEHH